MSETSQFIEKITQKLRHDRELRLDISHELQTHLDDAIEQYKAADYTDDAAVQQAIKDLGDPEELAEDLWQSNRSRMKLRAWCWWIARLTLMPACIVITLAFIISGLATTGMLSEFRSSSQPDHWNIDQMSRRLFESYMRSKMTATQRLIAFGDEQATDRIQQWQTLRDAFPDEPLYQLNYIFTMFSTLKENVKEKDKIAGHEKILRELERGQTLDPDNGVYALMRAMVLLPKVKYREDQSLSIQSPSESGETLETDYPDVFEQAQDLQQVRQIVAELFSAVDHPYICGHELDMIRYRMAQLPPARCMREYIFRIKYASGVLMPLLGYSRQLARYVCAAAVQRARAGGIDEALSWLDGVDRWQHKTAASSSTLMELLMVHSIMNMNLFYRATVYEIADQKDARDFTISELADVIEEYNREYRGRLNADSPQVKEQLKHAGIMLSMLVPSIPGYQIQVKPYRMAEYTMLDRGALTVLLLFLLGISIVFSVTSLWRLYFTKDQKHRPLLLWIGLRRLVVLLAVCVMLPVVVFALLTQTSLLGRQWGLDQNMISVVWYIPLFLIVNILLWYWGINAMRQQARSMGLVVPRERSIRQLVLMLFGVSLPLVLPVLAFYFWSPVNQPGDVNFIIGLLITFLYLLGGGLVMAYEIGWLHDDRQWFSHAMYALLTSVLIMLGVALLLCALILGLGDTRKMGSNIVLVIQICLSASFLLALLRMSRKQYPYKLFAISVVRSMSVLWIISAIVLAVTVGTVLHQLEAHYAKQMMAQSPVFIDMEIEKSNARLLKEKWAAGQPAPPRMVPAHRVD